MSILSQLSNALLEKEAAGSRFPKWSTLCLLRWLDLPTLDGAFLLPGTSVSHIESTINEFASLLCVKQLLVRSDGGREGTSYFVGGNTLHLSKVFELTDTLLQSGRAVILQEPTDRFNNRLTVNFLAACEGRFVVEILGPGYDVSDLNRGGVTPQYVIHGDVGNWSRYATLGIADVRGVPSDLDELERRRLRLENLGTKIFPGCGIAVEGDPIIFAEKWLQDRGYNDLWRSWSFSFDLSELQHWYEDAFLVASYLATYRNWKALVLSWSVLSSYRRVCWDIVDSARKYSIPKRHRNVSISLRQLFLEFSVQLSCLIRPPFQ